jgi:uncharacterized protein DUF5946
MTPCDACGAALGGTEACVAAIQRMLVQAQQDARFAGVYRLAFDAFCLQHPERHGVSAKSYAAHLMGLCHGIEHANRPHQYWSIPAWLNRPRNLVKPPLLQHRGDVTIADVVGSASPEEHAERVRAWANSVWQAYASQQHLARAWLGQALGDKK